jgi:hypothetical protein
MKTLLTAAAVALAAPAALATDTLTRDEIAKLPFATALAYAEAIDAHCFPDRRYVTADLAAAAITQTGLQNKPFLQPDQTREAAGLLERDQSACGPFKAFVEKVTATIPEMQPKMDAMLAALRREKAERDAAQARAERVAQCVFVVAKVKEFLAAHWSLANGSYTEELPRCIDDLSKVPEAGALLTEAKTVLPQMMASIKAQSARDRAVLEQSDVDPKRAIADWCARQSEKPAICDEAAR